MKGGIIIKYHFDLQCAICGYIPDDEDIKYTNYHLSKCLKCGELACDLCSGISSEDIGKLKENEDWTKYLVCHICNSITPIGNKRKFWLKEEYKNY